MSASIKWSSVVLVTDGGGEIRDGEEQENDNGGSSPVGRNHSSNAVTNTEPGGVPESSPADGDHKAPGPLGGMRAFSGVCGDGSEAAAGVRARRGCLPIHLGRLSCSTEAGIGGGARAVKVRGYVHSL